MRVSFQKPVEASFVKIADWRIAVWLDPFRMLTAQIVVNLLLKFRKRVYRVADYSSRQNVRRGKHNELDRLSKEFVHQTFKREKVKACKKGRIKN